MNFESSAAWLCRLPAVCLIGGLMLVTAGCLPDGDTDQTGKEATMDNAQQAAAKDFGAWVLREPATIREEGNRLVNSASLYLKQHAYNPVDWYPWCDEALERAMAEDIPIFLSIGYSSCHWCHVMEDEVFEDDEAAQYLNQHFVCIKVDREERPDLDAVYMEAMQIMTGSGGWPLNLFLTPELKPFYGATYMPREQFQMLSQQLLAAFETRRAEVDSASGELQQLIGSSIVSSEALFPADLPASVALKAGELFDRNNGGFLSEQKFPTPLRWQFLLHYYRKTGDKDVAAMVVQTLDAMGRGGIRDHLAGGFHRYTTDQVWLVPHFEKMLYDNAQLAALYTEASVVFDNPWYGEIARETLDFIVGQLSSGDGSGGFYSSFDADSGGVEGTYYIWKPDEISAVAGDSDGPALAALLGVGVTDNFQDHHGKASGSVISRQADAAEVAQTFSLDATAVSGLFDTYRPALLEERRQRSAPGLDKKVVTAWNGLAISALARGYLAFGDDKYLLAARQAAEFILNNHRAADGALLRNSTAGAASNSGVLDDYACFAEALFQLYMADGDWRWLDQALELTDQASTLFANPEGGYFFTAEGAEAPLGRQTLIFDSVEPSGNAVMLHVLLMAAAVTGDTEYFNRAEAGLGAYAETLGRTGLETAWWLDAGLLVQGPYYEVIVAAADSAAGPGALLSALHSMSAPQLVILSIPAGGAEQDRLERYAVLQGKTAAQDGTPLAYVCQQGSCQAPTGDVEELRQQVMAGWTH